MNKCAIRTAQSGNVIVYILGAVFLMGVLLMMLRGSNTPGANVDSEELMIRVSEVQQYSNELEKAVGFVLRQGFSESDLRFAHPNAPSAYGDINDTPRQQIYGRNGGGATWRAPPPGIQTAPTAWIFNAENLVDGVGTTDDTPCKECADLIAFLPNVTENFCLQLNRAAVVKNTASGPPVALGAVNVTNFNEEIEYNGTQKLLDADGHLFGKREGCFERSSAYHYYRVLLPR